MSWLLDTHVVLWSQLEPERLGPHTRAVLEDPLQVLHVASVSTLEIARLTRQGRLQLRVSALEWVEAAIDLLAAISVNLAHQEAAEAYALPEPFHPDPADRILVATARRHELRLITADRRILEYPHVDSLDAQR